MTSKESKQDPHFNIRQVLEILPHRYPFLLIDKVMHLDLEKGEIVAKKGVTFNEHFFQGHFPQIPIMPGVLILESMAQAGGILIHQRGYSAKIALLLTVNEAKFRKPVFPGDDLFLHVNLLHLGSKGGRVLGKAIVNDQVVAEAEIGFALMDREKL